jgi:competence protein ComEC
MKPTPPAFYFFDVGQGDSELIDFGRVQILIDGGPPNGKALKELEKVLKPEDRSIDIVILTHPHLDHFGGLPDIASRYNIRKFITNGTISKASAYKSVPKPDIILGEGDNIRYGNYTISILGPNATERTDSDPNKTSLVLILEGPDTRIFYAGDMQAEN